MFKIEFKKTQNSLDNNISDPTISSFVNKKLLLVEDNAINAFIAKTLITKWDIEVDHAINGGEAIEKAINTNYDYILMDIHMPGMDGFEATKIIRTTNDFNTTIPIFGLTADISAKDNAPNNAHFTGFLLKPLEIEKLKLALTNCR
jgi:CheY-like chemotaxis protein